MYCRNCGRELKENDTFCGNCGSKIIKDNVSNIDENNNLNIDNKNINQINNYSNQNYSNTNNNLNIDNKNINQINNYSNQNYSNTNNNWKNTLSLVIGGISIALVFIFQIFTIPLSILGLVFGIMAVKNNNKHKVGLILNTISLVLAFPILIIYSVLLGINTSNPAVGTWDCKTFSGYGTGDDYEVTMRLNNNNEYMWNKYNDEKNNYIIGTYEIEEILKTNNSNNAKYYQLTLNVEEFVKDGILQNGGNSTKYEMGILDNDEEAIMINTSTYNMYYCYRK